MAGAEPGAAYMQGASTCVEQNTERVGRSGQSQRQCDLSIPFTVTMEWGWNHTLPPTSQACDL